MDPPLYIGLAVTAHDADLTCEAVFSGVQITGNVSGQWQNQDVGIESNDAERMYVAIADSAVDFKDYAALAEAWLDEQLWPEW